MHDHFVALTTEDDMSILDVIHECHEQNWSPVVVIQYKDRIVVPLFPTHDIAMEFLQRNFGKKHKKNHGSVGLDKEDLHLFADKGWETQFMNFPRKFTDQTDCQLFIETFEIPQGFQMPNQGIV